METRKKLILKTCVLAGKIMMENGSEVYRVEDTMNRIAANAGEIRLCQLCDGYWIIHGL